MSNLNNLVMRISADTSGLESGVKLTRSEINRLNRIQRMAKTDTDKLRESTALLQKGFESGAIDLVQFVKQMDYLESRYKTTTVASANNAAQLSRVQSLVKSSTPETAKLAMQIRELRRQYAAGNVTAAEFSRTNGMLRGRYQEARTAARGLTDEQQRQVAVQKAAEDRMRSVQTLLSRMTPETTRLAMQIRELRKEYEAGNVSASQFARGNQVLRERYDAARTAAKGLTDQQRQLADAQRVADERMRAVQSLLTRMTPETTRLAMQIRDLRKEYDAGNVSASQFANANAMLRARYEQARESARGLTAEQQRLASIQSVLQERQNRVRQSIDATVPASQRLARQMAELRMEYKRGAVSAHEYSAAVRSMKAQQASANTSFRGGGAALGALGSYFPPIVLGYMAIAEAQKSIDAALNMEQLSIQFEVLAGSAARGAALLGDVRRFAADTPLSMEGASQGARMLMTYGVAAEDVMDTLRRLGDISGGNSETLQRLARAFGQVNQIGRLTGEEVNQLSEAGFNPLQNIADRTGESMSDLRQRMSQGRVTVEEFKQAVVDATEEGGRFAGMMDRMADTDSAKINQLKAEIEALRISIGSRLAEDVAELSGYIVSAIQGVRSAVDSFNEATGFAAESVATLSGPVQWLLMLGSTQEELASKTEQAAEEAAGQAEEMKKAAYAGQDLNKAIGEIAERDLLDFFGDSGRLDTEKMIHNLRMANIELLHGAEYAERYQLLKAGATKEQLEELNMLRQRNEMLEQAKQAEEDRKKAITDARENRKKEVEELRQAGIDFAESARTPFQNLVDTLTKLREAQARGELSAGEVAMSTMAAQSRFRDSSKPVKVELPPSAQRGSREEYQLIANVFSTNRQIQIQQHRERIAIAKANEAATNRVEQAILNTSQLQGV